MAAAVGEDGWEGGVLGCTRLKQQRESNQLVVATQLNYLFKASRPIFIPTWYAQDLLLCQRHKIAVSPPLSQLKKIPRRHQFLKMHPYSPSRAQGPNHISNHGKLNNSLKDSGPQSLSSRVLFPIDKFSSLADSVLFESRVPFGTDLPLHLR